MNAKLECHEEGRGIKLQTRSSSIEEKLRFFEADRYSFEDIAIEAIKSAETQSKEEDPIFLINLGQVERLHSNWTEKLPRVRPLYAVKSNPDLQMMKLLNHLGCGFDVASMNEIKRALEAGAAPEDIIYGNPCKMVNMILFAKSVGVKRTTFDCESELVKMKAHYPECELILRIQTDDSHSTIELSSKFGCEVEEGKKLLESAKNKGLKVIGTAFHAGTGCKDPQTYLKAIKDCRELIDHGNVIGHNMTLLDIGGGYPGVDSEEVSFSEISEVINKSLDIYFRDLPALSVVGEPGRYFATSPVSLVSRITSKRIRSEKIEDSKQSADQEESRTRKDKEREVAHYFLNCGAFDYFFDSILVEPLSQKNLYQRIQYPISCGGVLTTSSSRKEYETVLHGTSGRDRDTITLCEKREEMHIDEYLLFNNVGAYGKSLLPGSSEENSSTIYFFY